MREDGTGDMIGTLLMTDLGDGRGVRLQGVLSYVQVTDDFIGLHVHEFGDVSDGCDAAGGHYNPDSRRHGDINEYDSHVGDFGNVEVNYQNDVQLDLTAKRLRLNCGKSNFAIGRALVVSFFR